MILKQLTKIPIKVDMTFYLVLLLALFSGGATGFFTLLCIFGLVTLHEYGHSYAAIKEGLFVESITLFALGGVASIRGLQYLSPGKAAYIAIAGPAVNFVLAFIAGITIYLTGSENYALYFFFVVNQLLGFFNLIPTYPMDGGRLLHSLLYWYYDDYNRATKLSAQVGITIGGILLLVSLVTGNLLLCLIFGFITYTCYTILTKEIPFL